MERQKLVILPKLNRCNGDLSRQWFIYFSCRDPKTGKMKRFRIYDGFSLIDNANGRIGHGEELCRVYAHRLKSGWTPFCDDQEFIYDDHVQYKTVAEIYGTKRRGNNTVRVWISRYLATIHAAITPSTYSTYVSKLRIFALWLEEKKLQDNDVMSISNDLIVDFFNWLINIRKLSGNSIQKYENIITSVFEHMKKEKVIYFNPVHDLPKCNRINDQAPRPIMRDDIVRFKKELIKDPQLWLAVQLEFYCLMRPGHEIRELRISDIDFGRGTVRIDRRRAKKRIERIVTVPKQLMEQMISFYQLHTYPRDLFVFSKGGLPGTKPIGKNNLRYRFNAIRKRLNMPYEYKFYSWKHTGAVEADEAGLPMADISRHAGHNDIKTTGIYLRNKRGFSSKAIREGFPTL